MKPKPLWRASVVTTSEAEDAVAEALAGLFASRANAYMDLRTGRTTVSVFCESPPAPPARLQRGWRTLVARLRSYGLETGRASLRLEKIRRENWAESWKRHFQPLEIGNALLLKPSWVKRQPKRGQAVIVLDPGLSFGTGQHPTTSFCLRQLIHWRRAGERQSVLDIGSGSGILAIAAAKLGYSPVHAFDFDPEAVRVARANVKTNRVQGKVRLARGDLSQLPTRPARTYDLVCANLISTLLIGERKRLTARVKPRGMLVVAGILRQEFHLVRTAFESLGFHLVASKREQEWASGTFVRPA